MAKLEKINEIEKNIINSIGGYHNLTEFDQLINKINRAKIKAYKNKYNQVFLGKINNNTLKEYKKGMIYNFACDYILPSKNTELEKMLNDYNSIEWSKKYNLLTAIHNKIESLNGIIFLWV